MAAVVCTLRLSGCSPEPLRSWIRWHERVGFAHLFLCFDDPEGDGPALAVARAASAELVTVLLRGDPACEDDEVYVRQMLNCRRALALALERGDVSWLLHIDIDELFFTRQPLQAHLADLEARGADQMVYVNHEGVPEAEAVGDYFSEVTLFRRHYLQVPLGQAAAAAMRFWEQRTGHGQYMLVYDNGKSAVRVQPGVEPASVHKWRVPGRTLTALVDPRAMALDSGDILPTTDPCILHFPVCGLDWFTAKYRMLGDFPSAWLKGTLPIAPSFHLDSRDVVGSGDRAAVEAFFREQVLFSASASPGVPAGELQRQLDAGVCFREELVREVLSSSSSSPPPAPAADSGRGCASPSVPASVPASVPVSAEEGAAEEGAAAAAFTYDKAWMLSNIAQQYLLPRQS